MRRDALMVTRGVLVAIILALPVAASATTLPTYVGVGSSSITAATTSCTPASAGVSWQANDLLLVMVQSENQSISLSTANGFAEVGTQASQAAGTAATDPASRLAVYYKIAASGSDSMPVVADSGDHTACALIVFRGVNTAAPFNAQASGNDSAANDTSSSVPGATTNVANTLVVAIAAISNNSTVTTNCSGQTNASLGSLTERYDSTNTSGLGGGICAWTGTLASAGTYDATTATLSVSSYKGALSLALAPWPDVSLGATAAVSASLGAGTTVTEPLAAGMAAAATVSAAESEAVAAVADVAPLTAITAAIQHRLDSAADMAAASTVGAPLNVSEPVAAALSVAASVSPGMTVSQPLAGQLDAAATLSAGPSIGVAVGGAVSGSGSVAAGVDVSAPEVTDIAGALSPLVAVSASVVHAVELGAPIDSPASVSAPVSQQIPVAGDLSASASVGANMLSGPLEPLAGELAPLLSLSAALDRGVDLAAPLDATSTVAGSPGSTVGLDASVSAGASVVPDFSNGSTQALASGLAPLLAVTAEITHRSDLISGLAAPSAVAGNLSIVGLVDLHAAILGLATVTCGLDECAFLDAPISGAATIGAILGSSYLASAEGSATLAAALSVSVPLAASAQAAASLSAVMGPMLTSSLNAGASVAAGLAEIRPLAGALGAAATVAATPALANLLSAPVAAAASLVPDLGQDTVGLVSSPLIAPASVAASLWLQIPLSAGIVARASVYGLGLVAGYVERTIQINVRTSRPAADVTTIRPATDVRTVRPEIDVQSPR